MVFRANSRVMMGCCMFPWRRVLTGIDIVGVVICICLQWGSHGGMYMPDYYWDQDNAVPVDYLCSQWFLRPEWLQHMWVSSGWWCLGEGAPSAASTGCLFRCLFFTTVVVPIVVEAMSRAHPLSSDLVLNRENPPPPPHVGGRASGR